MASSESRPSLDDPNMFMGDAINIATRSVHARLNKLILLRLPLAIPPRAEDPSAYTQGILHIAPLYIAFESLWHAALHAHEDDPEDSPNTSGGPTIRSSSPRPFPFRTPSDFAYHGPRLSHRLYTVLNQLYIPGLLRSARLRSDLRSLTGWSEDVLQARLEDTATTGRFGEIVSHIRLSAEKHPHVLLAYAWVLYMALFSGGRFIRATLESAGAQGFWTPDTSDGSASKQKHIDHAHGPLEFFHFPTPEDGEDLKHEFKQRLADLGPLLTQSERKEIVREATCIFENLILVINQLDDVCHTKLADLNTGDSSAMSPRSAGFRIRDSVIVTRERSYRAAKRSETEPEPEPEPEPEEYITSPSQSTSGSATLTASCSEEQAADMPRTETHASCDTVQLPSTSHRVEKDDSFSRRFPSSRKSKSDNANMDPKLTARLAKAMRFDQRLPIPERTPSVTGSAKQLESNGVPDQAGVSDGSDADGGPKKTADSAAEAPRRRRNWSIVQVALSLGMAITLGVAVARR